VVPELRRIGPYELMAKLGSGGMGAVYRARDTRTGRDIALKIMHAHLAEDPDYVRRFQREARIAVELHSPFIVRVLDSGQDGGQHYLVMEFVEGKNLAQVLQERRKLPPEEARAIATQVALALEAAHARGVVHRDIKPGNIIIAGEGKAKVTDFGIARAADSTTFTPPGSILGTMRYAAPEVWAGKSDIRSDIYSLGIVLYQMLAGRVPFEADTLGALMDMHRSQEPPTLESLGVRVPGDLRAIVARCLAKKSNERYQSPAELTAVLEGRAPAAEAVPTGGAGGGVAPTAPTHPWSGSDWFGGRRLRYVLSGVGAAGIALAAVLIAVAIAGGWGGGAHSEDAKVVVPVATSTPPPVLPSATAARLKPVPTSTPVAPTPVPSLPSYPPTARDNTIAVFVEEYGEQYAGDCATTDVDTDVGKYCFQLWEDRGDSAIYVIGISFSKYSTWLLLKQADGAWIVSDWAQIQGEDMVPPW